MGRDWREMADTKGSIRRWRAGTSSGGDLALTKPDSLNPSGYNSALYLAGLKEDHAEGDHASRSSVDKDALMAKKAWESAQSQMKQVGMYAFMMYMSGGSVHIFSIMMTFNGLYQPLMAILNSGKAFEKFRGAEGRVSTLGPQALFCLIQCGGLSFALYKLANIGLLPTHISDWVSGVQVPVASEYSARG